MTDVLNREFPDLLNENPMVRIEALKAIAKSKRRELALDLLKFSSVDKDSKVRYYARKTAAFLNQLPTDSGEDDSGCMDTIAALATVASQQRRSREDDETFEPPDTVIRKKNAQTKDYDARKLRLREVMKSGDSKAREKVIQGIMRLKDKNLFNFVVLPFMNGNLEPVVLSSALALAGHLGSTETGAAILPLLKHPDHRVRANAVEAAGNLDLSEALPDIVACLRDDDNRVKGNAATAIRGIDPEITIATLSSMISSSQIEMVDSAIFCLERSGLPQASHLLINLLEDSRKAVVSKVFRALEYLAEKGDEKARTAVSASSNRKTLTHQKTSENELLEIISEDSPGPIHTRGSLTSTDPKERLLFLASCKSGETEKTDLILNSLKDERDHYVLSAMLTALGRIGDSRAVSSLLEFLNYGDTRVRANSVEALGQFDIIDLDDRIAPLTRDKNHRIVTNAVVALRNSGAIDHSKILRSLSSSTDPIVRRAAIHAVGRMGNTRHSAFLKRLFGDFDPEVAELARNVAAGLSDDESIPKRNTLASLCPEPEEAEPTSEACESGSIEKSELMQAGNGDSDSNENSDDASHGAAVEIGSDGAPVRPPSWEFSAKRFKAEASKWPPSKFEGMYSQLRKKRDEAANGIDKALEPLALFAADADLKTDNRALQGHIREIKELQDLCDRLIDEAEANKKGAGFLASIKKAVSNIKDGMDRKVAETRLRTECRALSELLLELKNNPFPANTDGHEAWSRARTDKENLKDLDAKLAILNEVKANS
ncbi:MAG: hypothetical protein CVV64_13200 [Candidatus Wallbacteria bacterium HGW-Wallbacteria-1]|jgi:HEAT repeat protein|uniref:HEAT repeat domain-containing protein n=1 Tax=Candidatus Wallbacteria bacterium HGW-Wallbacteria-1 TaxID=2013854 RepID=A0A2N1PMR8_9BACT|nr:MAG: hypothetical protein CVV64_13200 [Candidatus Wallbacteria bacterium HGW-Wallbacteria-1]